VEKQRKKKEALSASWVSTFAEYKEPDPNRRTVRRREFKEEQERKK
jgi:hypothetical protein